MFVLENAVNSIEWEHKTGIENIKCTCGGHLFDLCISDLEAAWLRCASCGTSTKPMGNALSPVKEALLMCFEVLKR